MTAPHPGDREYRNQTVRISELTVVTDILDNLRFTNCEIQGPAVLFILNGNSLANCSFDAPDSNALLWIVQPDRPAVSGAVGVQNCEFFSCRFTRIGFAGPPQMRDAFEAAAS